MSTSYSAYGTKLKRGDGGSGAATKASRTLGSTNSQIVFRAKTAGTAGNAISVAIVVAGNNTPLSVGVVGNAITVNSATNGSAVATSTVNDVISKVYQTVAAAALIDVTSGVGDGTGVVGAAASAALSGGTAGGEVFTILNGVRSLSGPTFSMETIDATHHTSGGSYREVIPSFKSGGEVSFDLLFDPNDVQHTALFSDFETRVLRNFQIELPDVGNFTYSFAAYVGGCELGAPIDDALTLSVTLAVTGEVVGST